MSTKAPHIIESGKENGGKRTVIRCFFHTGASVQPHYHTEFEETFYVTGGELLLTIDGERQVVSAGESITIPRKAVHSFSVLSLTALDITLEPASPGFEQALCILDGTSRDQLFQVALMEDMNLVQMAVASELTNSIYTGETGQMLLDFYNKTGEMINDIKVDWIEKYCK